MSRTLLFDRLPAIWKRLDLPDGLLERFLGVLDSEFNRVHAKTGELLDLRSVDRIPDRYLPLLGVIVGHEWDFTETYHWNRERVRHAIRRHSYKGSTLRIQDVADEAVATITIDDRAAHLWALGRQGRPGHADCFLIAPNYNHDGAIALTFQEIQDLDRLQKELAQIKPHGFVWHINYYYEMMDVYHDSVLGYIPLLTIPRTLAGEDYTQTPPALGPFPDMAYPGAGLTFDSHMLMSNDVMTFELVQSESAAAEQSPPDFS